MPADFSRGRRVHPDSRESRSLPSRSPIPIRLTRPGGGSDSPDGFVFLKAGRREEWGELFLLWEVRVRWGAWRVELYGTTNFTNGHEWAG
jgi:hypothetical protein